MKYLIRCTDGKYFLESCKPGSNGWQVFESKEITKTHAEKIKAEEHINMYSISEEKRQQLMKNEKESSESYWARRNAKPHKISVER